MLFFPGRGSTAPVRDSRESSHQRATAPLPHPSKVTRQYLNMVIGWPVHVNVKLWQSMLILQMSHFAKACAILECLRSMIQRVTSILSIYNNMTTAEIQNCAKSPPERYTDIYDFPKIFFVFLSMSPRRNRIYHSENWLCQKNSIKTLGHYQ